GTTGERTEERQRRGIAERARGTERKWWGGISGQSNRRSDEPLERESGLVGAGGIFDYVGGRVRRLARGASVRAVDTGARGSADDKFAGRAGGRRSDFAGWKDADLLGQGRRSHKGYDERRDSPVGAAGGI